ncbi:MAG TPA: RHS repeat-associated core domain-containing protein, partial [Pirellulales bacterium]|nr:RHS repeat-associated core domain-containing protein [Pirellulales bacterium]
MYDPATGRFLSEDPTEFEGRDMNLYRYAKNDPMTNMDPTGDCSTPVFEPPNTYFPTTTALVNGPITSFDMGYSPFAWTPTNSDVSPIESLLSPAGS